MKLSIMKVLPYRQKVLRLYDEKNDGKNKSNLKKDKTFFDE